MPYKADDLIPLSDDGYQDYLFATDTDNYLFVQIGSDMSQLNSYCVLCLNETFYRLAKEESAIEEYQAEKHKTGDQNRLSQLDDWIMETGIDISFWKDNFEFVAPATCVILLAFFLEKSLKSICIAYTPKGKSLPRTSGNKVTTYLDFLKNECGFQFTQPEATTKMWGRCKKIRNSFAHGDWDDVKAEIGEINLRDAFRAVTELLINIDNGQPHSLAKPQNA